MEECNRVFMWTLELSTIVVALFHGNKEKKIVQACARVVSCTRVCVCVFAWLQHVCVSI